MTGDDRGYDESLRAGYKHVRYLLYLCLAFGMGTLVPSVGDIIRRCTQ